MKRHGDKIEKAAAAIHMNEARAARSEQKTINTELIHATRSTAKSDRHRDIVQWLAPTIHEASYFADDLISAQKKRHACTCIWIHHKPEFKSWFDSDSQDPSIRMLWMSGIPGARKTVLSSYVIDRCRETSANEPKNTNADKNSVLSVTRSLVYQFYRLFPTTIS